MSEAVKRMFAGIAPQYDFINRLMSARRDVAWRRTALAAWEGKPERVLDLACGTFDLGLEALALGKAGRVHGCDFCTPMMAAGAAKRHGQAVSATTGDALHLPYADASFDGAMAAYGWRNFGDPEASARELHRVLAPGGQLLILEFYRPTKWWPRLFYATFGRFVFPAIGWLIARDASAYRYLHDSVQGFLSTEEATMALQRSGFTAIRWIPFFGGVSHAVLARRA